MTRTAVLRCRCGDVEGTVADAAPETANRVLCYCDDCQAYAHHLGRADLLDENGGSDIVQVAPAALSFSRGVRHLRGLRLGPKGLYRWYAGCCRTPVGNTLRPAIPFVGVPAATFADADAAFGRPIGAIQGRYAIGEAPPGSRGLNLGLMARVVRLILGWRLRGRAWPHPFFDRVSGAPIYPIDLLSAAERDALRPACGPRPAPPAR